uniref:Uncharacterized protein n=1 Tax=viral metagenome TaxID=1070528 RepID=A0A6C0CAK6_9ZZZZ
MQISSNEFVDFYFSQYRSVDNLDKMLGIDKYTSHFKIASQPPNPWHDVLRNDDLSAPPGFEPPVFRILNVNYRHGEQITRKLCTKCHIRKQYLKLKYCRRCCK